MKKEVIVKLNNSEPFYVIFKRKTEITNEDIQSYLTTKWGFDKLDGDYFTIVEKPLIVKL